MKNSNKKFFLGLTVAVLLPFSFYFIAKMLKKDKLAMPPYYHPVGVKNIEKNGVLVVDTIYQMILDFVAINQLGDEVNLNKDLHTKMLLISFIKTQDSATSTILTQNIAHFLHRAFRKNDTTVQFISLSLDPQNDNSTKLKNFAAQFKYNSDNWWFLIGDAQSTKMYVNEQLHLKIKEQNDSSENILLDLPSTIVLVDKQRMIRGYYNALDTLQLKKCADDIGLISMQKRKK